MILYSDHIIRLEYDPACDLLLTSLTVAREYDVKEVRSAFLSIITHVNEYNITSLLLDFTRNTLDLQAGEYKVTVAQLTVGLLQTSLRKVARVSTADPIREEKIASMLQDIQTAVPLPIQVKMFPTKEAALQWLLGA
ncbi:hypothetical protein H7F15_02760 [Pontibacter sp. Tf4]|uniref:hypothetical protein n=1 Tax=Pontibacter sp. Tf4 TaxID=2761620 RepID=UPI0016290CAA|nr:hypothetical protein [Pontibacter sp. Tf4]MBB6609946.1 hypothetical protein [Pontibacter sp. Tf4]